MYGSESGQRTVLRAGYETERRACLLLSLVQARLGRSVVSRLGDVSLVEAAGTTPKRFARIVGATERGTERVERIFAQLLKDFDPDAMLSMSDERGIELLTLADDEYPRRLRETPDPPPALYVDGALPEGVSEGAAVAVVGPRKATVGALDIAERIGEALARRGVSVVSGLALGVDAAAHRGSLSAGRNGTVGVLGCGIDVVYPRQNRDLFSKVRKSGAVVSEYFLGEAPLAWRFPARNRIVSGLSVAVVVVEAPEKSGSLITARHAADYGREVWAIPGPVGMEECKGSNRLLADGASVLWDVDEFVETVAPEAAAEDVTLVSAEVPSELPESEAKILAVIGFEGTGADEISGRCGIQMKALLPALTLLELKGYLHRDSSGGFVRRASLG